MFSLLSFPICSVLEKEINDQEEERRKSERVGERGGNSFLYFCSTTINAFAKKKIKSNQITRADDVTEARSAAGRCLLPGL